MLAPQAMDCH